MNDSSPQRGDVPSAIKKLIFKSIDDVLTADDVRILQDELRENPHARRAYLEAVHLHIDLNSHSESVRICNETFHEFPEDTDANEGAAAKEEKGESVLRAWFTSRYATAMSYAATVLIAGMCLGCGLGIVAASVIYRQPEFRPIPWNRPVADDVIARVITTHDARWQEAESPETLPTRSLRLGDQIRLQQGLMSISFKSGATVLLEGPCVFEMRSPVGGKLYAGKLCVSASGASEGFAVETASQITQISTGQLGVMNDDMLGVAIHAMVGEARTKSLDSIANASESHMQIPAGSAVRMNASGVWTVVVASDLQFVTEMPRMVREQFTGDSIYLGNLFDDSITSSLSDSLESDGFQAAAETIDLGVAAVRDGGLDVDFYLVDGGVQFNLKNVGGGGPRVRGLPANDTYRSTHAASISTTGKPRFAIVPNGRKTEEGIGMSANEMMTFDLDEIRAAGKLTPKPMRFIADRAGINDYHEIPNGMLGSARTIVIVSNETEVIAAYVDGEEFDVEKNASVYSFNSESKRLQSPLRRNGRFVKYDVPLPKQARFLTLATVMCGAEHDDHAVFSGARLELDADAPQAASDSDLALR